MACFHPVPAVRYNGAVHMISRDQHIKFLKAGVPSGFESLELPCGKCLGCRLEYSRQWSQRIMFEAAMWPPDACWFITLTYDDDHLPPAADPVTGELDGASLEPRDLTLFLKRLREYWQRVKGVEPVRFFACGEYGDRTSRPHYHVCVFNLPLDDLSYQKDSRSGFRLYTSPTLSRLWNAGFVEVQELTPGNAAYCARYVVKKAKIQVDYHRLGVKPEFVRMSRRPGIGAGYLESNLDDIYKNDLVYLRSGGHAKPCRFFDRKAEDLGLDLTEVKEKRKLIRDLTSAPVYNPDLYFQNLEEKEQFLSARFRVFSR